MPEIYAEWINRITGDITRISFKLAIGVTPHFRDEKFFQNGKIIIRDYAISLKTPLRKSTIYCDSETQIREIVETLRNYILEYYTTQEKTLKIEVVP